MDSFRSRPSAAARPGRRERLLRVARSGMGTRQGRRHGRLRAAGCRVLSRPGAEWRPDQLVGTQCRRGPRHVARGWVCAGRGHHASTISAVSCGADRFPPTEGQERARRSVPAGSRRLSRPPELVPSPGRLTSRYLDVWAVATSTGVARYTSGKKRFRSSIFGRSLIAM
jgi:hypothetical protein